MAITRIKNNQITDATILANAKLVDYSVTASKLANNITYGSDLTVSGNLTVTGQTTTVDTISVVIEDPILLLAKDQTGSPAVDIGYIGERGTSQNIAFVWDESAGEFVTVYTNDTITNTTVTIASYASFHTNDANIGGNIVINGTTSFVGNVIGTVALSGNLTAGNILTPGLVSATGNLTGGNVNTAGLVSATGNVIGGNVNTAGIMSSTGNAIHGNILTGGLVSATGNVTSAANVTGGNITTAGLVTATGTITGGNLATGGTVSATGNVTGGNVNTGGLVSATGNVISAANVTGGNLTTAGLVTATGNVTGGNVNSGGLVSATGNVIGGNVTTAGLVSAAGNIIANPSSFFIGNGSQLTGVAATSAGFPITAGTSNIAAATNGNIGFTVGGTSNVVTVASTGVFVTGVVSATGTVTGSYVYSTGEMSAAGNVVGSNVQTAGYVSATGNIIGSNVNTGGLVSATGNIISAANVSGGNLVTGGLVSAGGNVIGSNVSTGGLVTATGNITGGNLNTGGLVSATGNVIGGNVNTTGLITATGNVTSAANITGGNLLTSGQVSATGNINGGNLNITGGIFDTNALTITTAAGNLNLSPAGNIVLGDRYINGLQLTPQQDADAASKYYVDIMTSTALAYHTAVVAATTTTLATTTGGTITYAQPNGASNGVGATLTTTGSFNLIDTANVQTVGTRILVKDEANAVHNGVYVWSNATVITRATDADEYGPNSAEQFSVNDYFFVSSGNVNLGSAYVVDAPAGVITFGTSNIAFAQFSQAQVYSANTAAGLNLTGQTFSAKVDNNTTAFDGGGNIIVKASANLTTPNIGAATGTSLSVTGNVTGGNLNTGGLVSATGNVTGGNVNTSGIMSATGNVTGGNVNTGGLISSTGNIISAANVSGGNVITGGIVSATGNVTGGNVNTAGLVSATGNVLGGNLSTAGLVTATGNVTGGNLNTAGLMSATGNVTGGNVNTAGLISATGNIISAANVSGGNLVTVGLISATGNVTGGNLNTSGLISATGNIIGGNLISGNAVIGNIQVSGDVSVNSLTSNTIVSAGGNVTGGNILTGGLVSATGNITSAANVSGGNVLTGGLVSATGNVSGGNVNTGGLVSATGNIISAANVSGGNLITGGLMSATGNVTGGNVNTAGLVTATGNVTGGNLNTGGLVSATGNIISAANVSGGNIVTVGLISATGNITGGNISTAGQANLGNIRISGDNITDTNGRVNFNQALGDVDFAVNGTAANIFYVDAGANAVAIGNSTVISGAALAIQTSDSMRIPTGATGSRPGTAVVGMLRFNTSINNLEFYDGSSWQTAGTTFTVIASQTFNGDGSTVAFTLSDTQTTASCIVSINGVVQVPSTAYSVTGTTLTFTEAPQSGDLIEVRKLTTTTTLRGLSNASGNAAIEMVDTSNDITVTGDLIPSANVTFDLGNSTNRWRDGYFSGASLTLGNVVMKNVAGGNTIGFFGPDGTTPATIASTSVDTTTIANGTSNVTVAGSNGNVRVNVGGTSNVAVFDATGLAITGNLSVTGNATLSGNILGDRVQNGTTSFDIQTAGGNANITVAGTSNVAVFATTGAFITGVVSATGNVTSAGNISGNYLLGNAFFVTGLSPTRIYNGTSEVNIATASGNANITIGASSNVVVAATTGVFVTGVMSATGNITGGNLSVGTGTVNLGNIVNTNGNGVGNIGSSSLYFNTVFAKATSAQYADLAEKYEADAEYLPGTVLCFGGEKEVTLATEQNKRRVAGVVSTNPSYIMNAGQAGAYVVTVALTGRVPTRVTGSIRKGDMLVATDNGFAKSDADPLVGTVIGKALEDFDGQDGIIEVVVGRV